VDLIFNFPNAKSGPGYRKMGWEVVDRIREFIRVQRPISAVRSQTTLPLPTGLDAIVGPALRAPATVRRYVTTESGADRTVQAQPSDVADELTHLYRNADPDGLHAARDAEFFRWRFSNPEWTYATHVGFVGDDPTAGIVTGTRTNGDGMRITRLTDVQPLKTTPERENVLAALLSDVIATNGRSDLFVAPSGVIPERLLSAYSFRSNDSILLSSVANPSTLMVHPLGEFSRIDRPITDPTEWTLTFVEYDTA
ncbi:MAG: hypothetical protein ACQETB_10315, partial [Halobacteriota archaeon]